ncbi:PIG-L family deacetylase [Microvirga puerhi]|uniref:PIG-L family deacetylase n=1 Tax=Microvirga puerhi TaxID=2876078 RepID=A0ABS7VTP4_9HYPH|nr:PIG-L family deacetylase [Microvirga puerhi]MBZ6078549.1 PIG-L family deacetylase [Microvirga puerhi]
MLSHHERIAQEMSDPALVRLHRKLERLSSVLTVMNTGAHPDDEANGMLAALRFGLGMRIVVACSTRGEGGQNALGPERGGALGVLRTREMEEAARILDADVVWLGHGPDDPVHDFGFSKSGDDTLARWGENRIIERLVRAYRAERPDIVIPTFLDVPGQHGHHRAMTRAAEIAVGRAADPSAYPHHFSEGLRTWQVAKFYLPAWSGGGATYDDEVDPPEATVIIRTPGNDIATGAPFARIGEWSRTAHLSQGMGIWLEHPKRAWPLHLLKAYHLPSEEKDIRSGLKATVGALAATENLPPSIADLLLSAQQDIERAQTAFPNRQAILGAALSAAEAITRARAECDEISYDDIGYRLARKQQELDLVICEVSGLYTRAWTDTATAPPGGAMRLHVYAESSPADITVRPILSEHISVLSERTENGQVIFDLAVSSDATISNPYPPYYRALGGNGDIAIAVTTWTGSRPVQTIVDLEEPFRITPQYIASVDPEAFIVSVREPVHQLRARISIERNGRTALPEFTRPENWKIGRDEGDILVTPPAHLKPGRYHFNAQVDNHPVYSADPIAYPHIGRTLFPRTQRIEVLALDLALPLGVRIGYIGSGNDRVGLWLERMGLEVVELTDNDLNGDLSVYTTIVVGIFAFGKRQGLSTSAQRLRDFVEAGGHLVTLYHKPTDNWDPSSTPPRFVEIGSPSVRWRVTDPNATVNVLAPEHPLLLGPNKIGPDDWKGWDKERGIYFAARWDNAYMPLLVMNDPQEAPLSGALISGSIGSGRHTHVSLVLHHQLDRLVPGAFRLLANLVQPARR